MKSTEHLHMPEYERTLDARQEPQVGASEAAAIERLMQERLMMLQEIEHDISQPLYEALYDKLQYERRALLELASEKESRERREAAREKKLPSQYFIHKRLSISFF